VADPYPFVDGKFVIDRSTLPGELRRILEGAERLDTQAKKSRSLAEEWEQAGKLGVLAQGKRILAASYDLIRDHRIARLWTYHGARPPMDLRFEKLKVVGE
jgi:hypothetical protein